MLPTQQNYATKSEELLAVSLELAKNSWKSALYDCQREHPAVHTITSPHPGERLDEAVEVIERTRCKWGLSEQCRVVVVFEMGQDGFWIARALQKRGYEVLPIDPASVPVERHVRRAKTDRLDAIKLVMTLLGWLRGERNRMRVVHMPTPEAEDLRHLTRERGQLQKEVQQHRDRIRKLLRTVGCWDGVEGDFAKRLKQGQVRDYEGQPVPAHLRAQFQREWGRLELAQRQLAKLEAGLLHALPKAVGERVTQLTRLKAVGLTGATRLVLELFWRDFDNRRQVGACVGLTPQPYDSGESRVDQGISKAGNRRVRSLSIEMAWFWLRYQPGSALSQWFARRTQGGGKRGKRIAIVAVARRLMIGLWRYLKDGVIPEGALLKG